MIKLIRLGVIKTQNRKLCLNFLLKPRSYHKTLIVSRLRSNNNLVRNSRFLSSDLENLEFPEDFTKELIDGAEEGHVQIKCLLYPNSSDPLIVKLNESCSLNETLEIFRNCNHEFTKESICQLVLVLWDQIRIEDEVNLMKIEFLALT